LRKIKSKSKTLYILRMLILLTVIVQDIVVLLHLYAQSILDSIREALPDQESEHPQQDIYLDKTSNQKIFLGWMIFNPQYSMWLLELTYLVISCWICLSTQYWINYPSLTKRQVTAILYNNMKTLHKEEIAGHH
jgi:hypothetical protein